MPPTIQKDEIITQKFERNIWLKIRIILGYSVFLIFFTIAFIAQETIGQIAMIIMVLISTGVIWVLWQQATQSALYKTNKGCILFQYTHPFNQTSIRFQPHEITDIKTSQKSLFHHLFKSEDITIFTANDTAAKTLTFMNQSDTISSKINL